MKNNYQNGKPIFGEYTTFENVFPEIKTIKVIVTETGRNVTMQPSIYNFQNFREVIKCSNSACILGGIHIGNIVREMVEQKKKQILKLKTKNVMELKKIVKFAGTFSTIKLK